MGTRAHCWILGMSLALVAGSAFAQEAAPAKSAEILSPAIQEAMKKAVQDLKPGTSVIDRIINLQDIGRYNVALAVVTRPAGTFQNSLSHDKITEIYYVLRGTGTQVTGTMVNGTRSQNVSTTIGPGMSSNSPIQNAKATKLGPGDVQIIPPGVAHGFTSIDAGGIDYLVFRVDPDHLLAVSK